MPRHGRLAFSLVLHKEKDTLRLACQELVKELTPTLDIAATGDPIIMISEGSR